jgi:hypothetical protein
VHTTVPIQNRVILRNNTEKPPYELWKGRPTNVKHFRVFGSKCYIKREYGRMGKFDSRVDKGVLVGYSSTRKAYKCYNLRLNKVVESINVTIDETGRQELKEEENESMEQLYEEESEDEKEVEGEDSILLIEVYVDDIIFGSTDDRLSHKFAKDMQNEFEMSLLGELSFFLGLQICQRNQGIFISQTKYIREMLKRFRMEDCKPIITPMQTSCKLSKDDDSKSTDQRQYKSMIGSLLYVTTSRPDVMQEVGQVAQFQAAPKESHVLAVKRIFRYLKGT